MKWYAGAILILALALALGLGLLAYAMYALLALLVVSRFLARRWIEQVTALRESNRTTAEVGQSIAVVVRLRNLGRLPIPWLLVEDLLPARALRVRPPRLRLTGERLAITTLGGGRTKTLAYQLHFDTRGYYQVGPLVLETGDLFGLHRRYRVATEPSYVLVYPRVVPIPGYDLASRRPIGEIRVTHRLFEDPTRIAGLREYQPGDPLSRIHWRATARSRVLQCKTYEPSSVAGATIVLDFHTASYPARNEPVRSEWAVTTAVSLAHAVYELGQQVGLITNGRDAADRIRTEGWEHDHRSRAAALRSAAMRDDDSRLRPLIVPTRRGPEQFERIRDTLARVELSDGLTLEQLLFEATSRLPHDATVAVVLPRATPEAVLALASLRRRGHAVTAVVIEFDEDDFAHTAGRLLAERIEVLRVTDVESLGRVCQRSLARSM
jgi:uncharacterized protein (DUF58 family)